MEKGIFGNNSKAHRSIFIFESSPAAVYSAEIATPKLRGRLTVLTSLAIAVGILMIYILGYIFPVLAHTLVVNCGG